MPVGFLVPPGGDVARGTFYINSEGWEEYFPDPYPGGWYESDGTPEGIWCYGYYLAVPIGGLCEDSNVILDLVITKNMTITDMKHEMDVFSNICSAEIHGGELWLRTNKKVSTFIPDNDGITISYMILR